MFPRTIVGGVSVSRLVIGTNWFIGCSHNTAAKDQYLKQNMDRKKVADILEVFLSAGVDAIIGNAPLVFEAVQEAQQRTGRKMTLFNTPGFQFSPTVPGHPMISPKTGASGICW